MKNIPDGLVSAADIVVTTATRRESPCDDRSQAKQRLVPHGPRRLKNRSNGCGAGLK